MFHVSCPPPKKNIPDLHQNAGHIKKGIDNSWMENVGTLMVYIIYLCLLLLYFRTLEYIDRQVCVCVQNGHIYDSYSLLVIQYDLIYISFYEHPRWNFNGAALENAPSQTGLQENQKRLER